MRYAILITEATAISVAWMLERSTEFVVNNLIGNFVGWADDPLLSDPIILNAAPAGATLLSPKKLNKLCYQ